jgi:hypothetical protein
VFRQNKREEESIVAEGLRGIELAIPGKKR